MVVMYWIFVVMAAYKATKRTSAKKRNFLMMCCAVAILLTAYAMASDAFTYGFDHMAYRFYL